MICERFCCVKAFPVHVLWVVVVEHHIGKDLGVVGDVVAADLRVLEGAVGDDGGGQGAFSEDLVYGGIDIGKPTERKIWFALCQ